MAHGNRTALSFVEEYEAGERKLRKEKRWREQYDLKPGDEIVDLEEIGFKSPSERLEQQRERIAAHLRIND